MTCSNLDFLPKSAYVYSLIVFEDGAKFPDLKFLPDECYVTTASRAGDAIDQILSEEEVFTDAEVMALAYEIRKRRILPDKMVREAHIRGVQKATGRDRVLE